MAKVKRGRPKGSKNKNTKRIISNIVQNVPRQNYFHVKDGSVLKNLFDLADKLEKIDDDHFRYHVRSNKDDFRLWVNDVMKELELAKDLSLSKNRNTHTTIVLKHIVKKFK